MKTLQADLFTAKLLKHVKGRNDVGSNVAYISNNDVFNKLQRFEYVFGQTRRMIEINNEKPLLKLYKIEVVPELLYGHEKWT